MSRWEDDNENEEFWTDYTGNDDDDEKENYPAIEIEQDIEFDIYRQQEMEIADKQLNIKLLSKAIKLVKSNWIFWFFSNPEKRMLQVKKIYETMIEIVE